MSGGLSVPFAAWGLFFAPESQKELFFVLSVMCFVFGAYLVWARERTRVQELEGRQDKLVAPGPDWPIQQFFAYLRPDLKASPELTPWEEVGLQVRDKLSTGQLRMWGRKKSETDNRAPLTELPREYWASSQTDFTYSFLLDGHQKDTHVRSGRPAGYMNPWWPYADLHVNQAEALRVWPAGLRASAAEPVT